MSRPLVITSDWCHVYQDGDPAVYDFHMSISNYGKIEFRPGEKTTMAVDTFFIQVKHRLFATLLDARYKDGAEFKIDCRLGWGDRIVDTVLKCRDKSSEWCLDVPPEFPNVRIRATPYTVADALRRLRE